MNRFDPPPVVRLLNSRRARYVLLSEPGDVARRRLLPRVLPQVTSPPTREDGEDPKSPMNTGFSSAPKRTRTSTGHTAHKALNLVRACTTRPTWLYRGRCYAGAGRDGRIWTGVCCNGCCHAGDRAAARFLRWRRCRGATSEYARGPRLPIAAAASTPERSSRRARAGRLAR